MFHGIEAVIFDLDGTLMDSMWMWEQIDIEYFDRFNIPFTHDYQMDIAGMSFHETAVYFKERFNFPDSIEVMKADWVKMTWDKYANVVDPKPGALKLLKRLKDNGIKTGIATSNELNLVKVCLDRHGIYEMFDAIHTCNEVQKGKPSPDIYNLVAKSLDVDPARCLVFEDLVQGIQAGKNAGMRTCGVEDAYSIEYTEEKIAEADYYIKDFTDERILNYDLGN